MTVVWLIHGSSSNNNKSNSSSSCSRICSDQKWGHVATLRQKEVELFWQGEEMFGRSICHKKNFVASFLILLKLLKTAFLKPKWPWSTKISLPQSTSLRLWQLSQDQLYHSCLSTSTWACANWPRQAQVHFWIKFRKSRAQIFSISGFLAASKAKVWRSSQAQ